MFTMFDLSHFPFLCMHHGEQRRHVCASRLRYIGTRRQRECIGPRQSTHRLSPGPPLSFLRSGRAEVGKVWIFRWERSRRNLIRSEFGFGVSRVAVTRAAGALFGGDSHVYCDWRAFLNMTYDRCRQPSSAPVLGRCVEKTARTAA